MTIRNMQDEMTAARMTRRNLLKSPAALMAAASVSRGAFAASAPLTLAGWQYNPQIVAENVGIFQKLYNEKVDYQLVPGEFHAVVETMFTAGKNFDMVYSEEDHVYRWSAANWTRDIEGLPGVEQIKASMLPSALDGLYLPNGKLAGLPYYAGHSAFVYNEKHLDQAKIDPPETWEEFLDHCRKLKKDKVSAYPYTSAWARAWDGFYIPLFALFYSEGADVFDKQNNPIFDAKFRKMLELHKTLYADGLVPPDIFSLPQQGVPSFATGQYSFMVVNDYDQKVLNDPKLSQIAGHVKNALMPGATHSTFSWAAFYLMGANADAERAWNLLQFFGGKASDGQYHVIKRWALEFGLGTPYREVLDDPEVVESFRKWRDLEVTKKQLARAKPRKASKTLWFSDWAWYMMGETQEYIRGNRSIDELIDGLSKQVETTKSHYPE